jgi:hypothetical protein
MSVVVIFEGRKITGLSQRGAEQFVKMNKGAYIEGVEEVKPIEKKKLEEPAAEVKVERTRTKRNTQE